MHLIWKRPDGFHSASPSDYEVFEVGSEAKIWLHKDDKSNFPFRISGGWQDEDASARLNQMVNLLKESDRAWIDHLKQEYHNAKTDKPQLYLDQLKDWLETLKQSLKGDHWEQEIMEQVLLQLANRLEDLKPSFVQACRK